MRIVLITLSLFLASCDDYETEVAIHEAYCDGVNKNYHPAYKPEVKCGGDE